MSKDRRRLCTREFVVFLLLTLLFSTAAVLIGRYLILEADAVQASRYDGLHRARYITNGRAAPIVGPLLLSFWLGIVCYGFCHADYMRRCYPYLVTALLLPFPVAGLMLLSADRDLPVFANLLRGLTEDTGTVALLTVAGFAYAVLNVFVFISAVNFLDDKK
ncbi:hypothetical protein ACUH9X_02785 [Dermabacteraceae bacterium P13147]